MGKGDKKSKRGKIAIGSYGNARNRKKIKARVARSGSRPAVKSDVAPLTGEAKAKVKRAARKKKAE